MDNVCSSVSVYPQERELLKSRDRGHLVREKSQERVDHPSFLKVGREWGPIKAGQSEPGQQSPD